MCAGLQVHPFAPCILSCSRDGTLRCWHLETMKEVGCVCVCVYGWSYSVKLGHSALGFKLVMNYLECTATFHVAIGYCVTPTRKPTFGEFSR